MRTRTPYIVCVLSAAALVAPFVIRVQAQAPDQNQEAAAEPSFRASTNLVVIPISVTEIGRAHV